MKTNNFIFLSYPKRGIFAESPEGTIHHWRKGEGEERVDVTRVSRERVGGGGGDKREIRGEVKKVRGGWGAGMSKKQAMTEGGFCRETLDFYAGAVASRV